jgi:hypothetical protein
MAKKFLIAVAGIVAVMAALVVLPGVSKQSGSLSIEYYRDNMVRDESGRYNVAVRETLKIGNDGSASYSSSAGQPERRFTISGDEMKVLRELFLNTGFMDIPKTDYPEKAGLANYTRYELSVADEDDTQSIRWVNPEAGNESTPSIIVNAGTRLDAIIERNS